ncbi:MAG: acyltransferase family protein, partial [Hyphomicrobiales bacterium]
MGNGVEHRTGLTYRPEIDGLRAVAVISVILFHADFSVSDQNPMQGGFLGVDIFFVISGYLITSIILRERNGQGFSVASFYERRARRILPVLLTVMLVSTPMAWMFLIPEAMRDYCYSIIGSILFSSNFYFWSEDPYWTTDSQIRPFLHTWSLAVEEQFYLIMPLVLLLLCRLENKARLTLVCILALASMGIAQWTSSTRPEFAFYLLPARMWELLAGTMMAVLEQQRGRANSTRGTQSPLTQHLPTFGFFLVILPMFMFSSDTQHPSVLTLVPVIGTMLIIGFANGTDLTVKILSSRPFVAIGLMSYGLYMWHFPIFSFGEIILRDEGNAASVILIFLSVLLASITYFSIERPARNRSLISIKSFVAIAGTATLLIMTFSVIGLVNGYAFRFPAFLAELPKAERIARHQWTRSTGGSAPDKRIIVAGDSHMQMLAPELRKLAFDAGYEFAVSTYTGCQLIAGAN